MSEQERAHQTQGQSFPQEHQTPALDTDEGFNRPERHGKGVSVAVVVAILGTVGAVLWMILESGDDVVYAYTVDQAVERQEDLVGKNFKVRGIVEAGSINATPGSLDMSFKINHNGKLMTVAYHKPLPDMFKDGSEVIAEGTLSDEGVLEAESIVAKCPSKYEQAAPTAKSGALGEATPAGAVGAPTEAAAPTGAPAAY
jgi:cytochrome c-type biogenesis protein CcmE